MTLTHALPSDSVNLTSSSVFRLEMENFHDENWLDKSRTLLIEVTYLLSNCLKDRSYWRETHPEKNIFEDLIKALRNLDKIPGHEGEMIIRLISNGNEPGKPGQPNYEIRIGDIRVDLISNADLIRRRGEQKAFLSGLLQNAFKVFWEYEISCLYLKLPDESSGALIMLRNTLNLLSFYPEAVDAGLPIEFVIDDEKITIPIIRNEKEQPDPNLTLMAGLNRLRPEAMQEAVKNVDDWLHRCVAKKTDDQFTCVYTALLEIKKLKGKLARPPVEINNINWLMVNSSSEVISKAKVMLARSIVLCSGGVFHKTARLMECVFGENYNRITTGQLVVNIGLLSELIAVIAKDPENETIMTELEQNIDARFAQIPLDVIQEMDLEANNENADSREAPLPAVNVFISKWITGYKQRYAVREKFKSLQTGRLALDPSDYEIMATAFGLPLTDIETLSKTVNECFNDQGRFDRGLFEAHIPVLSQYKEDSFRFLWLNLKDAMQRKDRISFLNVLYLFVDQTEQKRNAVFTLWKDIIAFPDTIFFSDRNAFMLAGMLLRKFNKELDIGIEMTPEEVLLVKEGLDLEVITVVSALIAEDFEKFLRKIKSVHLAIQTALDPASAGTPQMPVKYLLALERELHIFLALVGGQITRLILRSAVRKYGNPDSNIFLFAAENQQYMNALLQHLKVLVRALGRLMEKKDISLLNDITSREDSFRRLGSDARHDAMVTQVFKWVDRFREEIKLKYE